MCWTAHLHVLFYDSVRETSTKGTKNISHDCQNGQDPVWAAAIEAQVSQKRASKVGCLSQQGGKGNGLQHVKTL